MSSREVVGYLKEAPCVLSWFVINLSWYVIAVAIYNKVVVVCNNKAGEICNTHLSWFVITIFYCLLEECFVTTESSVPRIVNANHVVKENFALYFIIK